MKSSEVIRKAERQLVASYVHSQTCAEDRLSHESFSDPIALSVLDAIESMECQRKQVSIQSLPPQLEIMSDLPAEIGVIVSEMVDHEAWVMPQEIVQQLADDIQKAHARRILEDVLRRSSFQLESGEPLDDVVEATGRGCAAARSLICCSSWPDPEPLFPKYAGDPYPVDCLPDLIQDAVLEVAHFTQAPIPMVALSALSYASLSTQHLADIERDSNLTGPISLFCLIVAESGERKSACDKKFSESIREYQSKAADDLDPKIYKWRDERDAWAARREGIKNAIREAAKKGKDDSGLTERLVEVESEEPVPPREPRFLAENETPASFRNRMSYMNRSAWLSVGLMTSEGGTLFGGHGMGKETALDYIATQNKIWDGGEVFTGRRGDGDQDISGARLTCGIAVQETVLGNFLGETLARQSGYLSRFLLTSPQSNRGYRPFRSSKDKKGLTRFGEKAVRLLSTVPCRDGKGRITPGLLRFSSKGKERWIEYFNETEYRQREGRDLRDFPDIGSKTADHAARLAGILHFWSGASISETVSLPVIDAACQVAGWHLNETRQFLAANAVRSHESDAAALEKWIIERFRQEGASRISLREILQFGPYRLRKRSQLAEAIEFLTEKGRMRTSKLGRSISIEIHPSLLNPGKAEPATVLQLLRSEPSVANVAV